jgi:beta-lactamase superfamily II metal-dependent hydrolase
VIKRDHGSAVRGLAQDDVVDIYFLNVGQGDATLAVDMQTKKAVLIDCPAGREAVVEDAVKAAGAQLTIGLITHWDLDHYGGMLGVIDSLNCASLYFNHETLLPEGANPRLMATLKRLNDPKYQHINFIRANAGDKITVGNMDLEFLAPTYRHILEAVTTRDRNLASGVISISAHGVRAVVGGDADGRVWRRLIDDRVDLEAEIFRWPHHGALRHTSGFASGSEVLDAVQPKEVVLSVGTGNRYKHPLPSVGDEVTAIGARLMCTQVTDVCHGSLGGRNIACAGSIHFRVDPDKFSLVKPDEDAHNSVVGQWASPICR